MNSRWPIVVAACIVLSTIRADGGTSSDFIQRIYFTPVRCTVPYCEDQKHHGNVHIVYASGKDVRVTSGGNCEDNPTLVTDDTNSNPKLSPDHRMTGWLEGKHVVRYKLAYFAGTQLVLYRNAHTLRRINGEYPFIEAWFFWHGGSQVALKSRRSHGPAVDELHDVATGRLVATFDGTQAETDRTAPRWAQRLRG